MAKQSPRRLNSSACGRPLISTSTPSRRAPGWRAEMASRRPDLVLADIASSLRSRRWRRLLCRDDLNLSVILLLRGAIRISHSGTMKRRVPGYRAAEMLRAEFGGNGLHKALVAGGLRLAAFAALVVLGSHFLMN